MAGADRVAAVLAARLESFAEVLAAEALVGFSRELARAARGLHLKVGTAMI